MPGDWREGMKDMMISTVRRAKLYISNMKASDSMSEHHRLIVDLLLEVKCLNVQVQDRGNSYRKTNAEVERLNEDREWQIEKNVLMFTALERIAKSDVQSVVGDGIGLSVSGYARKIAEEAVRP